MGSSSVSGGQGFFRTGGLSVVGKARDFTNQFEPTKRVAKLFGKEKAASKITDPLGLFEAAPVPEPIPGLGPEQEREFQKQAFTAAAGRENAGGLGGRSREQVQQEIFKGMVGEYVGGQQQLAAQKSAEEQTRLDKLAAIRARREKQLEMARAAPGLNSANGATRGFLA